MTESQILDGSGDHVIGAIMAMYDRGEIATTDMIVRFLVTYLQ